MDGGCIPSVCLDAELSGPASHLFDLSIASERTSDIDSTTWTAWNLISLGLRIL
jgi:hypothetical protein